MEVASIEEKQEVENYESLDDGFIVCLHFIVSKVVVLCLYLC